MQLRSMNDLFIHSLQDLYFAEKALVENMPRMAKEITSPELAQAFKQHLKETKDQVARLEEVFRICNMESSGKKCPGIEGLVAEAMEVVETADNPEALDAGLLAAAQSVEHYEISKYGTLVAWAEELGIPDAATLLSETLAEEKKTDKLLSQLAEQKLNRKAA